MKRICDENEKTDHRIETECPMINQSWNFCTGLARMTVQIEIIIFIARYTIVIAEILS